MGWPFKDGQAWSKVDWAERAGGMAVIKESWKLMHGGSPGGNEKEWIGGRGVSLKDRRQGWVKITSPLTFVTCSISVLPLLLLCCHYPICSKTMFGKGGGHIWVPLKSVWGSHVGDFHIWEYGANGSQDWSLGPFAAMPIHSTPTERNVFNLPSVHVRVLSSAPVGRSSRSTSCEVRWTRFLP